MWNPLEFVAESRCVDAEALKAFAFENEAKYGIVVEYGRMEVSTWHVDALVSDFRNRQQMAGSAKGVLNAQ